MSRTALTWVAGRAQAEAAPHKELERHPEGAPAAFDPTAAAGAALAHDKPTDRR